MPKKLIPELSPSMLHFGSLGTKKPVQMLHFGSLGIIKKPVHYCDLGTDEHSTSTPDSTLFRFLDFALSLYLNVMLTSSV
jgi:hypothetical protein